MYQYTYDALVTRQKNCLRWSLLMELLLTFCRNASGGVSLINGSKGDMTLAAIACNLPRNINVKSCTAIPEKFRSSLRVIDNKIIPTGVRFSFLTYCPPLRVTANTVFHFYSFKVWYSCISLMNGGNRVVIRDGASSCESSSDTSVVKICFMKTVYHVAIESDKFSLK